MFQRASTPEIELTDRQGHLYFPEKPYSNQKNQERHEKKLIISQSNRPLKNQLQVL